MNSLQPWEEANLGKCYKGPEGTYQFTIYIRLDNCSYWYGVMAQLVINGFLRAAKLGDIVYVYRTILSKEKEAKN